MRKSLIAIAAAVLLPASAWAGPLTKELATQYALTELADFAIANTRCKLHVPETHFQTALALNRQGWTDEPDADLAVMEAYEAGKRSFDGMSKSKRIAKCEAIASWYRDFENSEGAK